MKEVTIKLYEFEELSEEIKAPLIAKQCKELGDDYCEWGLEDDMQEYASEIIERKFDEGEFESNNVYYDLSYSQGSGAMVEFEGWDIHILETILYGNNLTREWIDKNIANFNLKVTHSGHYYHEYSFEFEEDLEYQEDAQTLEELGIEREEYIYAINEFIVDINKELYTKGKESVEWYWNEDNTRDEAIDRLSQYHYLEDGEVYLGEFEEEQK